MQGFAASRYEELVTKREPFLHRARECALLTLPTLFPPEGNTEGTSFSTPHQSMGARGVNNLASKLLLTLFPPNTPFFKLDVDDITRAELTANQAMRGQVEEAFNVYERAVMTDTEGKTTRPKLFEVMKQLVVGGNTLLYLDPDGPPRVFRMDSYVTQRDPTGTILEIVTRESVAFRALPEAMQKAVEDLVPKDADTPDVQATTSDQDLDLYTYIWLEDGSYKIMQEIMGIEIEESRGSYPEEELPWLALRFVAIDGEDYGRGYVEEYFGDLNSLEMLQEAIVGVSSILARVVFLLDPAATVRPAKFAKARNGDVFTGREGDVNVVQADKLPEMRAAIEIIASLEQRLSFAFLLNTAIQRKGERVTAEEIRYMAGELEDALGGIYSVLSQDLQLPFVRVKLAQLTHLPDLPESAKAIITTGVDALGRGHELMRLDTLIGGMPQGIQEQAMAYFNLGEYLSRRVAALGIDGTGLVKSEEEVQQEREQAMAAQLADRAAPNLVNQVGNAMQQGENPNG